MTRHLTPLPGYLPQSIPGLTALIGSDGVQMPWADAVRRVDWLTVEPAREIRSYRGQTSRPGWHWTATNGDHVRTESQLEGKALLFLDFDPSIIWIRSQPFGLAYTNPAGKVRSHYPDFLCGVASGTCLVVDVHAPYFVNDRYLEQCAATEEACCEVGWEYRRYDEFPEFRLKNLERLHHSAFDLFEPVDRYVEPLLEVTETPCSITEAISRVCADEGDWIFALPVLHHLIWRHEIGADLDQLLQPSSMVWRKEQM